jgi:thymidylate kinase
MKLIGIAGTNGSGKDTLGELLASDYGYQFMSVSEPLREECRRRGIEVSRENLRMVSVEWRREGGLGALVDKAVELYKAGGEQGAGLAIASLRNPGEVVRVHELGGTMVWLDSDSKIRYERIRNANRGRDDEDNKTYEQFLAEEQEEMHSANGDTAGLNMTAVCEQCDVTIVNETGLEVLKQNVETALGLTPVN